MSQQTQSDELSQMKNISLVLNTSMNYNDLLDMTTNELEFRKIECQTVIKDLKTKIIAEFDTIKPALDRMREWKQVLHQLKEREKIYSMFVALDKNQTLISASSINSSTTERPHISLSELFRDIENGLSGEATPPRLPQFDITANSIPKTLPTMFKTNQSAVNKKIIKPVNQPTNRGSGSISSPYPSKIPKPVLSARPTTKK